MRTIRFPFNGVAGSSLTTRFGVSLVGSGQILNDASDATYASYSGGGGAVDSSLPSTTVNINPATLVMSWRIKTTMPASDHFNIYIEQFGGGVLARWQYTDGPVPTSDAAGWLTGPMTIVEPTLLATSLMGGTALSASVEMLGSGGTRVSEAEFLVEVPNTDAPPCRMFPRSDGLGVGAGRNYPPAKSQQRSSRGVGYY